jgi:hypothetical protein
VWCIPSLSPPPPTPTPLVQVLWTTEAQLLQPVVPGHAGPTFTPIMVDATGQLLSASTTGAAAGGGRVLVGAVFQPRILDCDFSGVQRGEGSPAGDATLSPQHQEL